MPQPDFAATQATPPATPGVPGATGTPAAPAAPAANLRPQLLELRHISRYFQVRQGLLGKTRQLWAVADVSLDLAPGETLGLVGESGCGKSTLAKIAAGLLPPSSGEVRLDGAPLYAAANSARSARPSVHMVFQDPFSSLNPRLTIGRSIAEPLDIEGVLSPDQRQTRVMEMLQLVGLSWLLALLAAAALSFTGSAAAGWVALRYFKCANLAASRRQLAKLGLMAPQEGA